MKRLNLIILITAMTACSSSEGTYSGDATHIVQANKRDGESVKRFAGGQTTTTEAVSVIKTEQQFELRYRNCSFSDVKFDERNFSVDGECHCTLDGAEILGATVVNGSIVDGKMEFTMATKLKGDYGGGCTVSFEGQKAK